MPEFRAALRLTVASCDAGGGGMSERCHRREELARADVRGRAKRATANRHVFGHLAGVSADQQELTRALLKLDQKRG